MKTAVIAGATGLVGKQLMFKLLESSEYSKVTVLVRKPMEVKHPRLNQVITDFDKLEEYASQMQGEDFFCCLGTTMKKAGSKEAFYKVDFTYCKKLAEIAEANKAQRFLLISAIGSDKNSAVYYSKVKGELEEKIKELNIPQIHIFHPSILVGNRLEFRFGEIIGIAFAKMLAPLMFGPLTKYKPMEVTKLAKAMLVAAQRAQSEKINFWTYKEIMAVQ